MKITTDEYIFITGRKRKHTYSLYNYELISTNWGGYRLRVELKMWVYLILFLPCTILDFFTCIWDGGLKIFTLPCRLRTGEDLCGEKEISQAKIVAASHRQT